MNLFKKLGIIEWALVVLLALGIHFAVSNSAAAALSAELAHSVVVR